jgi:hypothetical protein
MAWTITQIETAIDQLQTALAKGERAVTVTFADRSHGVTYKTSDEIIEGIRYFESQRAALMARPRQWATYSSKGLN